MTHLLTLKTKNDMNNHEESKLDKLSLSEAEELLTQEMDELIGGSYIECKCADNAHAV